MEIVRLTTIMEMKLIFHVHVKIVAIITLCYKTAMEQQIVWISFKLLDQVA